MRRCVHRTVNACAMVAAAAQAKKRAPEGARFDLRPGIAGALEQVFLEEVDHAQDQTLRLGRVAASGAIALARQPSIELMSKL